MKSYFTKNLSRTLLVPTLLFFVAYMVEASTSNKRLHEKLLSNSIQEKKFEIKQDTLFTALKVHKIDGKVTRLETAKSFVLASIKSDSAKQTVIRAYSYSGEILWKKNYDSEHANIAASEDSDVIVIIEPIVKDDPYDTSLRDCRHSVFDKSGKELSTFQNPCHSVFPMGKYGYLAINTEGQHAYTSIYDFKSNKFIDYGEAVHNSTIIDTNKLVSFTGQQELQNPKVLDSLQQLNDERQKEIYNHTNELTELTNNKNRDSVKSVIKSLRDEDRELRKKISEQIRNVSQWRIASLEMNELILGDRELVRKSIPLKNTSGESGFGIRFNTIHIAYEPVSKTVGFGASFLMHRDPVQQHERKIFFIDDDGNILNILNISGSIQQFEFINESTVLVLTGTTSKLPTDYSLLLYDLRENRVLWEKDYLPFGARGFSLMFPVDNSRKAIIHTEIAPEAPCKTDVLKLDIESGEISCPSLFNNHDILFRPLLIQNPSNLEEFVLLNAKKDRVIFAVNR